MNCMDFSGFEAQIGYSFRDKNLLTLAFTHSSYGNEHKKGKSENNERLEFLGDAALDLVVSKYIYTHFPEMPEGELTKLRAGVVCEPTLAEKARALHFGQYLLLGKGEESTGGRDRDSILADAFEAVIGAVLLDGGMDVLEKYVLDIMTDEVAVMKQKFRTLDCKTHLQEVIQKTSKNPIHYAIVGEQGPDHSKVFVAEVRHDNKVLGRGQGKSKKEAEQNAAYDALEKIEHKETV